MTLETTWFVLIFVLLAGYAVLDGFDLGVGVLQFMWKRDEQRRIAINAIAPVWDGNEVWLLAGGGALFAAFPPVYATVFSGFYLALVLVLVALMARAVSMEFRGKVDSPRWRAVWDWMFNLGSLVAALLLGVALGNVMRGLPIDADGTYTGTFLGLLNPYALLIGVLTVLMFTMHGSIYLAGKTEGEMQLRIARLIIPLWCAFTLVHLVAAAATAWLATHLYAEIYTKPVFWVLAGLWLFGIAMTPYFAWIKRYNSALIASATTVAAMVGLVGVGLFPRLVPSSINLMYSLSTTNSSSSQRTLLTMLIIALIGMPLVIAYTAVIYRIFRGKVVLHEDSY